MTPKWSNECNGKILLLELCIDFQFAEQFNTLQLGEGVPGFLTFTGYLSLPLLLKYRCTSTGPQSALF